MTDFTLRERILIKLIMLLIEFIGSKQDGFYSHKLDSCVHELFYPKLEKQDERCR